jgi:hypothetical protein
MIVKDHTGHIREVPDGYVLRQGEIRLLSLRVSMLAMDSVQREVTEASRLTEDAREQAYQHFRNVDLPQRWQQPTADAAPARPPAAVTAAVTGDARYDAYARYRTELAQRWKGRAA